MPREKIPTPSTAKKREPRKTLSIVKKQAIVKTQATMTHFVGPEQRAGLIAEAAFFRAEKRGFAPGHEHADWLAAEAEVDAKLMSAKSGARG